MSSQCKACVFDAYGTLFDLHSAVARHGARIGEQAAALSQLWRIKQLEYSWIRSAMAPPSDGWRDFWSLTQDALDFAMQACGVARPDLRQALLEAYLELDAFPEVPAMLERLKAMGMRTAIVSNGSAMMLRSALASTGLAGLIDVVCSADDVQVFKPDPRLYALVPEALGVAAGEVIFHSSNAWDAAAGASFGFNVAWVNRTRQPREYAFAPVLSEMTDLTGVAAAIQGRGSA